MPRRHCFGGGGLEICSRFGNVVKVSNVWDVRAAKMAIPRSYRLCRKDGQELSVWEGSF